MSAMINDSYCHLISKAIKHGEYKEDRTSVGSNLSYFGMSKKVNIRRVGDGQSFTMPFIQCRSFAPRIAFEELMWMLRGQTDAFSLIEKDIHIWKGNTTEEYLQSIGKVHIETGTIGKGYGHQFRNFGGVDQLKAVFDGLRTNPNGRRHMINLWNASELDDMALEPCHYSYNFYHCNGKLSLHQVMRSSDLVFGLPYNLAFAAFFNVFMALALDMEPNQVYWTGADCHVYSNQIELGMKTIEYNKQKFTFRTPYITVHKKINSLDDILSLEWSDISVHNYFRGPIHMKVDMAV